MQQPASPPTRLASRFVLKPDGTEYEGAEIVRAAPGRYHADILVDLSGKWSYRWSAGEAGDEGTFQVERSAFV
jgi:hypothetical protein